MARIRSVHPEFFLDDAVMELSAYARLLVMGIWTQCDDHGIFEWKANYFKATVLPTDTVTIPDLLDELAGQNCIKRFDIDGRAYGAVRNFCLYQRPKKPFFKHPFPEWCRTYVALERRKAQEVANQTAPPSPPVTPPAPPAGEKPSHRREEERREEENLPQSDIQKPVVVVVQETTTTTEAKNASQGKAVGLGVSLGRPLPADWVPDEAILAKVQADFGMTFDDAKQELPAFHALNVQNGTLSRDWSATFYLFAKQWKVRQGRATPARVELSKPPSKPFEPSEADWDRQAGSYAKTGRWSHHFGPDPLSGRCRCPISILTKHGIDAATGERAIPPVKAVSA